MATPPTPPQDGQVEIRVEDDRTGMHPVTLQRAMIDHLLYTCSKELHSATLLDAFRAMAHTVRDRLVQRWIRTHRTYTDQDVKRVYYLSAEFLLGRALAQNLINLGLFDTIKALLAEQDIDLIEVLEQEQDPGLGNGGLGRLAACFMESMATLQLPGMGYGIRYEFGIFRQEIQNGYQVERGDAWLRYGNPWEVARHEYTVTVNFYGREEMHTGADGQLRTRWVDTDTVLGVPYDTPIAGFDNDTVNTLRLWSARASKEFNLSVFNDGDYRRAVEEKAISESISKVLYPNDQSPEGRELRLKQQYFFTCCSISDIIRRFEKRHSDFKEFPNKAAIQLNDTHPAIAVAELMRVLVDDKYLPWDEAWDITQRTIAFTNHTLLPEALERWNLAMFGKLLPRHLSIIYEINRRFLREVHIRWPHDNERQRRLSIIQEEPVKQIRMAHLAVVGSHSVNGVAALHSELIKHQLMPEFYELYPERFNSKTNGVTPRRWIRQANPLLTEAITEQLGNKHWLTHLEDLKKIEALIDDADFGARLRAIKRANKERLAKVIFDRHRLVVNPDSIFDVQIKRLHEYKRQLLNCLHIVALYQHLKANPSLEIVPRTFIFGGKAAPGYAMAKLHIKLINDVAEIINHDPMIRDQIKVVFLANYNVSLAEIIIPATDISEQISMAGKEASGTGNMKFAMNGALTVGTLDGANIEIRERVGADHFFLFGLNVEEVRALKRSGYDPMHYIHQSERLKNAIDLIDSGFFSPDDPSRFHVVANDLRTRDTYLHCADFDSYVECQQRVSTAYQDQDAWTRSVIHNIANMGYFSSDRTINEYAEDIWNISPAPVTLNDA